MKALLLLAAVALASCEKPTDLEAQRAAARENARLAARVEALERKNERLSSERDEVRDAEAKAGVSAMIAKLDADSKAREESMKQIRQESEKHQRMLERAARLTEKMEAIKESK